MGFHEVSYPLNPEYATRFSVGFRNKFTELLSGAVEIQRHDEASRRTINLREQIQTAADAETLLTFFHARGGAANGFRCRDWWDYTTAADRQSAPAVTDQSIGTGDGVTTTFQLVTTYVDGGYTHTRNITKPVANSVALAVAGVTKTEGVDFTVNTVTGIVTFTAAPALGAAITAGCEFEIPVRFSPEADKAISNSFDAYDLRSLDNVLVVEDLDPTPIDSERHFGGGRAYGAIAADVTVTILDGAVLTFNPSLTGLKIVLPDPAAVPALGADFFVVFNESFVYSLAVKDPGGTTIVNLGPGSTAKLCVVPVDAIGTTAWRAV